MHVHAGGGGGGKLPFPPVWGHILNILIDFSGKCPKCWQILQKIEKMAIISFLNNFYNTFLPPPVVAEIFWNPPRPFPPLNP